MVDCQEGFWNKRMAADFPHFEPQVTALLAQARAAGLPIIHLREVFKADGSDNLAPYIVQKKSFMVEGTSEVVVLPCAAEMGGETVLQKNAWCG